MTAKYYASLVGPLLGVYYPLPFDDEGTNRIALNTSRLQRLWHSVYRREGVEAQIELYGGVMLPDEYARRLDYDSYKVGCYEREAYGGRK